MLSDESSSRSGCHCPSANVGMIGAVGLSACLTFRPAASADATTIIDFNRALATETEGKVLPFDTIRRGVRAVLCDPRRGRYLLACAGEQVVGQILLTEEWNDWRNAWIWWFDNIYVEPSCRR